MDPIILSRVVASYPELQTNTQCITKHHPKKLNATQFSEKQNTTRLVV